VLTLAPIVRPRRFWRHRRLGADPRRELRVPDFCPKCGKPWAPTLKLPTTNLKGFSYKAGHGFVTLPGIGFVVNEASACCCCSTTYTITITGTTTIEQCCGGQYLAFGASTLDGTYCVTGSAGACGWDGDIGQPTWGLYANTCQPSCCKGGASRTGPTIHLSRSTNNWDLKIWVADPPRPEGVLFHGTTTSTGCCDSVEIANLQTDFACDAAVGHNLYRVGFGGGALCTPGC
jgi:hypothetical protein